MTNKMMVAFAAGFLMIMTTAWQTATAQKTNDLSEQDREFAKEANLGSLKEVELGRIALEKASSSEVKKICSDDGG